MSGPTRRVLVWLLAPGLAFGKVHATKLADKLLRGNASARQEAIQEFNKMPADAQYQLVPDFMVAMTDEDPEVRKIAARILKAMGVKAEAQVPDAKKAVTPRPDQKPKEDPWADLKKVRDEQPSGRQDVARMRQDERVSYADLRQELEKEKKSQVFLDPAAFKPEAQGPGASSGDGGLLLDSLKDSDPWVRAKAARRLGMIHPAPLEAIPLLIKMLNDKEAESRGAAAAALGSFGPLAQGAIPAIKKILADPDPSVRTIAADALKQIQAHE